MKNTIMCHGFIMPLWRLHVVIFWWEIRNLKYLYISFLFMKDNGNEGYCLLGFWGTYCLHLQVQTVSWASSIHKLLQDYTALHLRRKYSWHRRMISGRCRLVCKVQVTSAASKVWWKLSMYLIKHYATKTYGGVEM